MSSKGSSVNHEIEARRKRLQGINLLQQKEVDDVLEARNWRDAFAKLEEQIDPHKAALKAIILEHCFVSRQEAKSHPNATSPVALAIPTGANLKDAAAAKEILLSRTVAKKCAQFLDGELTRESVLAAYVRAASMGDIKAKLRLLSEKLYASVEPVKGFEAISSFSDRGAAKALSENDYNLIKDAFRSGDPIAMRYAGPLLTGAYRETDIEITGAARAVDDVLGNAVWGSIACDYDPNCGAQSNTLLQACLFQNICAANDVPAYLIEHSIPAEYQTQASDLIQRFRNAIDQDDWSFISYSRRPPTVVIPLTPNRPQLPSLRP